MEKAIVVPWDFSEKAEASFRHALILYNILKQPIVLLHVVGKDNEIPEAEAKLATDAERMENLYNFKPNTKCLRGDIFKTINLYSKEIHAPLVVMPLHNSKRAIKVIIGSEVPFYLVRSAPTNNSINDIIVPIDHYEENRVQLNWVVFLSKFFNSSINIIKPFINSNSKNKLMKNNIFFTKQLLDSKGVVYGVRTAKREMKFNDAIASFTKEIQGDLIFMMTYNFKDFMKIADKYECDVPILCLNPRSVKIVPDKY
ncbi:MAG: universal stress protein [Bacteroidales bacterium]|nr:universal stress protein [Bacteroidales bacterium]